jgi:NitT/TauT family transport system substrate-binding protein
MLFRLGTIAAIMLATSGAATAQVTVRIGDLAQSLNEIGSRAMIDQGIDKK